MPTEEINILQTVIDALEERRARLDGKSSGRRHAVTIGERGPCRWIADTEDAAWAYVAGRKEGRALPHAEYTVPPYYEYEEE